MKMSGHKMKNLDMSFAAVCRFCSEVEFSTDVSFNDCAECILTELRKIAEESEMEEQVKEVMFDIVDRIGVLNEFNSGWRTEVNLVSWNESNPKIDIRTWSYDHKNMSRGITLTEEEACRLVDALKDYGIEGELDE